MKILMIAPQPFFQPRGTPISVYQRLQGLSDLGHEVDLVTYHIGDNVSIPGVSIYRAPRVPFIKNVKIGPSWAKVLLDLLLLYKTIRMLTRNRYDIIHSHEEASFFSIILATIFRKPHLYDMHSILPRQLINFNFGNYRPLIKFFEILERWAITTCDALITIGVDLETYVKNINPTVTQITIENLPINVTSPPQTQHAVDEIKVKLGLQNKLPIVYTGTFERYQGLDLLLESAQIVKNYCPQASFVLVGGKPEQVEYWRDKARTSGLEECILFVGTVTPEEALIYLELAEILVSPRTEGLSVPLKIYTYLHSGKPTVATRLYAHTQVLSDDLAILVEPKREMFAEGILKLIRDPELRQRIGSQAQKFAKEKYNSDNYLTKLQWIYEAFQKAPPGTKRPVPFSGVENRY